MFKTCELRCHHLDRKDQYSNIIEGIEYLKGKTKDVEIEIELLQKKLKALKLQTRKRESFAALVKSTLQVHWINNPEVLEDEWNAKQDWFENEDK